MSPSSMSYYAFEIAYHSFEQCTTSSPIMPQILLEIISLTALL